MSGDFLCVDKIRSDFPIINDDYSYLDNAATTHSPNDVIESAVEYYKNTHSNVHSGMHNLSVEATKNYNVARRKVADFINANENEIVFSSGTTAAINVVVFGYARNIVKPRSEIIISGMEHHANLIPWQILAKNLNLTLKVIPVDDNGELDLNSYENMLSPKTAFVSLTHISNVLGTINPIKQMIVAAKKYGAKVLIDGAQAIAHTKVDVVDLDCDFYAFSAHKIYGPTGVGALFIKANLLPEITPFVYGGGMIETVSYETSQFLQNDPMRLEPGTPNISGVVGLAAAIDYVTDIGIDKLIAHEQELLIYATEQLNSIDGIKIYGNAEEKSGVISFTMCDIHAHDIASLLNDYNIAVRGGHHCAMPLVKSYGLSSITRVSFGIYNNKNDVDNLVQALLSIKKVFNV